MGSEHNALKKYFRVKKNVTINLKQILIISEKNVFRKYMETPGNNFTPKTPVFFASHVISNAAQKVIGIDILTR